MIARMLTILAFGLAHAGAGANFTAGVEGQAGFGAPVPSPDGRRVALTTWNHVGLWVLDLQSGEWTTVSTDRGAGFAPTWAGDTLIFKAITADADAPQVAQRWSAAGLETLDRGARVGQPSVAPGGSLVWTHGAQLVVRNGTATATRPGVGDVDLLAVNPATGALAWSDDRGTLHLAAADLPQTSPVAHPAWSDDGALLLGAGWSGGVTVVDPATGASVSRSGSHPRWVPGTHTVVYDLIDTATSPEEGQSPYTVLDASIWTLDVDRGVAAARFTSASLHPRFPAPLPGGDLLFVDSVTGGLWRLHGDDATEVAEAPPAPGAPPPPPCFEQTTVSVPYMHQLWDTPDSFDGGWSCGPTSCVQTLAKWSVLPSADIGVSWPYAHTSHWGWYIPNNYSFAGYNYDVWGVAKSQDCQGAHGFICREYGGAIWADITLYLNQHGVGSGQLGSSYDSVIGEVNAGYPLVASASVLGYGHILVIRGYLTSGGSPIHSFVVNDPYGNAGTGSWGNFDGEGAVYDWPGYDNGYLEIGISTLFSAHGTAPVVETPPADDGSGDAGTETDTQEPPAEDPGATESTTPSHAPYAHNPPSVAPGDLTALSDVGGCATAPGAALTGMGIVAAMAAGMRRRR